MYSGWVKSMVGFQKHQCVQQIVCLNVTVNGKGRTTVMVRFLSWVIKNGRKNGHYGHESVEGALPRRTSEHIMDCLSLIMSHLNVTDTSSVSQWK